METIGAARQVLAAKRTGRQARPGAFCALPEGIVEQIGLYTHMGARIDAAVLSRLVVAHLEASSEHLHVEFADATTETVEEGEFWISLQTVAQDLWARWFHRTSERALHWRKAHERFYERVRAAADRLEAEGYVVRRRLAGGKRRAGYVWTFEDTPLEDAWGFQILPYRRLTLMREAVAQQDVGEGMTNAVDLIGSAFVEAELAAFTRSEMITSLDRQGRGKYHDYLQWTRAIATCSASGERYISAGAWREGEEGRLDRPVAFPWVVIDIDGGDPVESYYEARRVVESLAVLGASLRHVTVAWTGGKGFHVRIPSGIVGSPVFANGDEARKVLSRFVEDVLDADADPAVFGPSQPVRLIGSRRPEGAYMRAWSAEKFQGLSMDEVFVSTRTFMPFRIEAPHAAPVAPELALGLAGASDRTRRTQMPDFYDTPEWDPDARTGAGSVVRAALAGVATGEEWHEPVGGKYYIGGSFAMYIACCHLIRKHGGNLAAAWEAALEVNERYDPPFPVFRGRGQTLQGRFASARRRLARDGMRLWGECPA